MAGRHLDDRDGDATKFVTLGQFIMVPSREPRAGHVAVLGNFAIPGEGSLREQYASFDVGNTHFVMIDDQQIAHAHDRRGGRPAHLASSSPTSPPRTPIGRSTRSSWRSATAGCFRPPNHAADADVLQTRASLTPLYTKYNVTLAMNGHDHEYERTHPITAGNPSDRPPSCNRACLRAPRSSSTPGAGADPYEVGTYPSDYRDGSPAPLGSLSTKGYIGCYVLLTLSGTTLKLTAYGMKAGGGGVAGDDVIDTLTFGQ